VVTHLVSFSMSRMRSRNAITKPTIARVISRGTALVTSVTIDGRRLEAIPSMRPVIMVQLMSALTGLATSAKPPRTRAKGRSFDRILLASFLPFTGSVGVCGFAISINLLTQLYKYSGEYKYVTIFLYNYVGKEVHAKGNN